MLSDLNSSARNGSLSFGLQPEGSIHAVVEFLRVALREFVKDKPDHKNLPEESINQLLCLYLNKKAQGYPFRFHSEFIENIRSGKSPKVDFGTVSNSDKLTVSDTIYSEEDSFFSLEAKRLPTPGSGREREYVKGSSKSNGGIERFKLGSHGSKLKHAAILGYVQKENFDHWYLVISTWIDELIKDKSEAIWDSSDKMKKDDVKSDEIVVELFSENSRHLKGKSQDIIKLYHFWINLLSPKSPSS